MPQTVADALNDGVKKREVFGWAMYDFANSGYTTVVLTAVFGAYFVGVVTGGAAWGTLAWTLAISASSLIVMLTTPAIGAFADLKAAKKPLLALSTAGCVLATAALAVAGRGDVGIALAALLFGAMAQGALVVNARVPADVLTLTQAAVIVAVGALGAASLRNKEAQ